MQTLTYLFRCSYDKDGDDSSVCAARCREAAWKTSASLSYANTANTANTAAYHVCADADAPALWIYEASSLQRENHITVGSLLIPWRKPSLWGQNNLNVDTKPQIAYMRNNLFSGLFNVLSRMHAGDVGITYMYGFILISLITGWRQSQHGHTKATACQRDDLPALWLYYAQIELVIEMYKQFSSCVSSSYSSYSVLVHRGWSGQPEDS